MRISTKLLITQRSSAIIAGISLLIMTFAAFFAYGYVHQSIMVSENSLLTLKNIQASTSLFELEILGWIVIIITDLLVSWAFYVYLKPVHAQASLIAALLRLVYTALLSIAVAQLVSVRNIAQNHVSGINELASQVMVAMMNFEIIWSFGLIIFGAHLIMVGYVALRAPHIPTLLSILLMVAGGSYMLIHLMHRFLPQFAYLTSTLEMILSLPMMVGEIGFGIWLLVRGRKISAQ